MENIDEAINTALKNGNKIEAIKICKDALGIEFAEAKLYIEELIQKMDKPKEDTGKAEPLNKPEPPGKPPVSVQPPKPKKMFRDIEAFEGRIRRTEYALSLMLAVVVSVILGVVALDQFANTGEVSMWIFIVYLSVVSGMLSQGARRCHDLGNSGWMQLVPFYFFLMIFQEGQKEANEYGESPK